VKIVKRAGKPESQRDYGLQPKVARDELPWELERRINNSERVESMEIMI
jgi:hypothetical protein